MTYLNIVELIEKNPITKLSGVYNNKLLTIIKEKFNETEQQLFVASFYCYLNYQKNDFVIDLDNIWEWLGFTNKSNAKRLLEKCFIIGNDYKSSFFPKEKQVKTHGGSNKEKIMLNIKTFKLFCLKAGTKKANEIHEYYINLEETLQDVIQEESNELKLQLEQNKLQLEQKEQQLKNNIVITVLEKELLREKTILEQFPKNMQCVYWGYIDDTNAKKERFIKFGNSNNLGDRVKNHKHNFTNFRLVNAFQVDNKQHIENGMKTHTILCKKRRSMVVNGVNQTELLVLDDLSFEKLDIIIKEIITSVEYSPENFVRLLEENTKLKKDYAILLHKQNVSNNVLPTIESITSLREIILTPSTNVLPAHTRQFQRLKDGFYHIDGIKYSILSGTREQVWNNEAYRTEGLLIKSDLTIGGKNKNKIVSMNKLISSTIDNRLNKKASIQKFQRQTDGLYHIEENTYRLLTGTKEQVFEGHAYKTPGSLTKKDLIIGVGGKKAGKIISIALQNLHTKVNDDNSP